VKAPGPTDIMKVYLNGRKGTDTTYVTQPDPSDLVGVDLAIGSRRALDADNPWIGMIDEVRFYSRALSAAEITNLYLRPTQVGLCGGKTGCTIRMDSDVSVTANYGSIPTTPMIYWNHDGLNVTYFDCLMDGTTSVKLGLPALSPGQPTLCQSPIAPRQRLDSTCWQSGRATPWAARRRPPSSG